MGNFLEDSLTRRLIFLTGKGGVGKTTVAAALAYACAKRGKGVVLVHTHLGASTVGSSTQQNELGFEEVVVDSISAFREYALRIVKFEKLYDLAFENKILKSFVEAAPGLSESMLAGKIWQLSQERPQTLFIVDLPSSGHAYAIFSSLTGLQKIFKRGFVKDDSEKVINFFVAPTTRLDLVTLPEELPVTETIELKAKLEKVLAIPFGYAILNQSLPNFSRPHDLDRAPDWFHQLWQNHTARVAWESENERALTETQLPIAKLEKIPHDSPSQLIEKLAQQVGEL